MSTAADAPPDAWDTTLAYPVAEQIGVLGIEAQAGGRRPQRRRARLLPVFGDEDGLGFEPAQRLGELLAERAPAVPLDDPDLVEPEPVGVVLLEEHPRVVGEEGAHSRLGELEDAPAGPASGTEVEVVLRPGRARQVEVVDALGVQVAPGVVVDHVDDDGDPIEVEDVDERLELVDLPGQLRSGQRYAALVRQQCVDAPQIRPEVGGVDAVVHLRREDVGAVVSHAPRAVELHDRQRLNRVDAQVGEVFHALEDVEELRDTVGPDVLPRNDGEEAGPMTRGGVLDQLVRRRRHVAGGIVQRDMDRRCRRCPYTECRAPVDQRGAHRRRRGDMRLSSRHRAPGLRPTPP
jgi:hypothetical protein